MRLKESIQKITLKSPAIVGFFSYLYFHFLFLYTLQFISRCIFLFHGKAGIKYSHVLIQATANGFPLDLSMICYPLILLLLLYILFRLFNKELFLRIGMVVMVILVFSTFILSFSDAELYRVWGTKNNSQSVQYLRSPKEAWASSSGASWGIVMLVTIPGTLLAWWIYRLRIRKEFRNSGGSKWMASGLALLFLLISGVGVRGGLQTVPISQSSVYYSNNSFENYAAVNSTWNFLYYVFNRSEPIDPEMYKFDITDANLWKAYLAQDTTQNPKITSVPEPNVVLVILESFSSYTSRYFSDSMNCTPFLDSLAKTGWSFMQAYSQGDRTDKGLSCIIGGWPGQPWQSIINEPDKAAKLPSLARVFTEKGYKSSFYYGGDLAFANMKAYLSNAGYNDLQDSKTMDISKPTSKWGYHDEYVFDHWIKDHRNAPKPFFSTVLTLSSHEPFDVPGSSATSNANEYDKFRNSIRYTDRCLRNFIFQCEKYAWFQNTIFVFVADHGRHAGLANMEYWQPAHFRIPIVFWGPALVKNRQGFQDNSICGQTDIATTLEAGIFPEQKPRFPFGRNLAAGHANMAAYFFSDGFGVVSPESHVVWENNPPRITEKSGSAYGQLLLMGKAMQYELVQRYKKY